MHHLADRVDPGIGSPRAVDRNRLIRNASSRPLQHFLNSGRLALTLKSEKTAAVVLEPEHHPVFRNGSVQYGRPVDSRGQFNSRGQFDAGQQGFCGRKIRPASVFVVVSRCVEQLARLLLLRLVTLALDFLEQRAR